MASACATLIRARTCGPGYGDRIGIRGAFVPRAVDGDTLSVCQWMKEQNTDSR